MVAPTAEKGDAKTQADKETEKKKAEKENEIVRF